MNNRKLTRTFQTVENKTSHSENKTNQALKKTSLYTWEMSPQEALRVRYLVVS
jgi:hypothetical protein